MLRWYFEKVFIILPFIIPSSLYDNVQTKDKNQVNLLR